MLLLKVNGQYFPYSTCMLPFSVHGRKSGKQEIYKYLTEIIKFRTVFVKFEKGNLNFKTKYRLTSKVS